VEKEQITVFYSWQSDIPENRNFIEDALNRAIKELKKDDELRVDPVMDRDTKGIAGSPDISKAIFEKIAKAQVFVCDVSIINQKSVKENGDRATPNPNVLVELGYALCILTYERIIMVTNTAYCDLEQLPFDLRIRRTRSYCMPKGMPQDQRLEERKKLVGILKSDLKSILTRIEIPRAKPLSRMEQVINSIDKGLSNIPSLVKKYMDEEVIKPIVDNIPEFLNKDANLWDEDVYQAINKLDGMIIEFCKLAAQVAEMDEEKAALAIYKSFGDILSLYTFPISSINYHSSFQLDVPKFIGYELFVIFFACLIREEKWELIQLLLKDELFARVKNFKDAEYVPFYHLSQHVVTINEYRNERLKLKRTCLFADILKERHTSGSLAEYVPLRLFTETDFFLFLRAQLTDDDKLYNDPLWKPWSSLYFRHFPDYLKKSERVDYGTRVFHALGLNNFTEFRSRLPLMVKTFTYNINNSYVKYEVEQYDFNALGTR